MTPIEQALYLHLVAPVVRDCGPLSPEAELAFAAWTRMIEALPKEAATNN
jgi:hypothetical protein